MNEVPPRFRGAPRRACDSCRRRKIRCNLEQPCAKCREIALVCQYNDIARRKGPKGLKAPILASLRLTENSVGLSTPSCCLPADNVFPKFAQSPSAPHNAAPCSVSCDASLLLCERSPAAPAPVPQRISPPQLQAHFQVFMKYLYPIMPVVDGNALLLDCANPDALHHRRYALLVALSAAAHFQLNLDMPQGNDPSDTLQSGHSLIKEATQTLHQFDPLDDPHVDTLLTMFFLFAAYGNLRKQDQAWHFLSQSISFVYMLKLNVEATYSALSQNDADMLRRIYWLLFVTERAYALQTGRPVMLRGTIQKPAVFRSRSPTIMYGFASLISLFESIIPEFYDWNTCDVGEPGDLPSLSNIYKSLAFALPLLAEVSETSRVDFVLTQHWLQTRLWQFYKDRKYLCQTQSNMEFPTEIPAMAGKNVMACLSSVAQKSTDAHGIGAEQKLYDIGECVFQLTQQLSPQRAQSLKESIVDVKDVLCGILTSLSRIRGAQSYLFPALLQQSQELLGFGDVPQPLREASPESDAIE
ncbi:fungal-specific transcription factor domain-containing protein [Talaromyces proteolyticus]|uniref:Fungal-specific transcription factor domain-containing protein n=1 Tax=Talaromyces proteolyticus TaxID=1131652 RepID=A0AAD4KPQ2_9EURO|nr:fungal-specific transcription factor domain-containing protein [Talaromyces proteolyticus]KAH8696579.1 fungal-specific transcription factor domain-containing protein [Talaromyces proteolyticus]